MTKPTEAAQGAGQAQDLERSRWVAGRMKELPKYCIFFYNLLLDPRLSWEMKEHSFGTLRYIFEENDIIADDDPVLGRLDDLTMAFRCFTELIARLPAGTLAIYEEVLAREGIPIRSYVAESPMWLDKFYHAISGLYKEKIAKHKVFLGNAIKTGALVKALQEFLGNAKFEPWSPERLVGVEAFLESFKAPTKREPEIPRPQLPPPPPPPA
jgi:hypothetical protein